MRDVICDLFSPVLAFMDLENDKLNDKKKHQFCFKGIGDSISPVEKILHMKSFYSIVCQSEKNPMKLINLIYEKNLCTYCNQTFCMTVSTADRSFRLFSRLANSLKNWQRSTIGLSHRNQFQLLIIIWPKLLTFLT